MIYTFKYFRFRQIISFFFSFSTHSRIRFIVPLRDYSLVLFVRAYRVSETIRLYISSWSVHRLNPRSMVYDFLTRDVTYLANVRVRHVFVPILPLVLQMIHDEWATCRRCLSGTGGETVVSYKRTNFPMKLVKACAQQLEYRRCQSIQTYRDTRSVALAYLSHITSLFFPATPEGDRQNDQIPPASSFPLLTHVQPPCP